MKLLIFIVFLSLFLNTSNAFAAIFVCPPLASGATYQHGTIVNNGPSSEVQWKMSVYQPNTGSNSYTVPNFIAWTDAQTEVANVDCMIRDNNKMPIFGVVCQNCPQNCTKWGAGMFYCY